MREEGFTLLEMIMVVAIMGIIMSIASFAYKRVQVATSIESETKAIYADLLAARSQALFQKTSRSVTFSGSTLTVYPTSDGSGAPLMSNGYPGYKQPISTNLADPLAFNSDGTTNRGMATAEQQAICVGTYIPPGGTFDNINVDSIVISTTGITMGRRTSGGCSSANFESR